MLSRLSRRLDAGRAVRTRLKRIFYPPSAPIVTSSSSISDFDPYEYTSGCWMRDDVAQRQARRVDFDFRILSEKALLSCPSAKGIIRCDKLEGNFNRAFIFHLDNGAKVVARIPFPVAGPARLTTNSEVATLAYVRDNTTIPVPKVLDWNDDPSNPAGTEYIIMEHAPGVPLTTLWADMNSYQHVTCVKNLALLVKQMHSLSFPAYGSIYFADAPISDFQSVRLAENLCIGPHCDNRYWPCLPGEPRFYDRAPSNRGPWATFDEFTRGLLDAGIARIPPDTPKPTLPYRGTVEDHLTLISRSQPVLESLAQDQRIQAVSAPCLFHPDLHKRNIFVDPSDPTKITALIDWQSASLDPAFFSAGDTPDLCNFPESLEDVLDHFEIQKRSERSAERIRLEKDVELCIKTWEVGMRGWAPKLHRARILDTDLLRPFRYCYSSWRDSSTILRDGLVRLNSRWDELGLSGSCPYQPSQEELAEHAKHLDDLKAAEKLKDFLVRTINCNGDGWVPAEACDVAKAARNAALSEWLGVVDDEMDESKARQLWPFDI